MTLLVCFGTRPEYIKVKSILDNYSLPLKVCFTGQHQHLLTGIKNIDYNLGPIKALTLCRLNDIMIHVLRRFDIFEDIDAVLVQGDTTTACAIALSAFHNKIPIIHLEAGLRTYVSTDPYPEEFNRRTIGTTASLHLCPTENNKQNLKLEKIKGEIHVVGNTGLDTLDPVGISMTNLVLVTMHRRENHKNMALWFREIDRFAQDHPELDFQCPLHPNPMVQKHRNLLTAVKVIEPLPHAQFTDLLKKARFVISDSGGIQEECSFYNKKIIVCRRTTERPESLGTHSVLCDAPEHLYNLTREINDCPEINAPCPYGDGRAIERIIPILTNFMQSEIFHD
jgi:UDP-N-acetylglucosamine 2-epimerase (non-hydrolysing)